MADAIESETFVIHNPNGTVSLDPWAGKTREQLKHRCGELCRALGEWQEIAMMLSEIGRDGLSEDQRNELDRLIEAYRD